MTKGIAVKLENLTKVYKLYSSPLDRLKEALSPIRRKYHSDFHALNNISLDILNGETVGIIGRNGSGKSTLLKLITGVLSPTSGNIIVNGKIAALLELGSGFNPELTGKENVYFNGMLMGYSKKEIDDRLDDMLAFADIGNFVDQPVKTYSSGMFVRLAFAVAINVDPDILIVDEAMSVGDVKFQRKCFYRMEEFRSRKKTIIYVSHDVNSINNLCDRVILLDNGQLIQYSEPKIVTQLYQQIIFNENVQVSLDRISSSKISENNSVNRYSDNIEFGADSIRTLVKSDAINANDIIPANVAPQELRHGNMKAEIIDFGIFDKENMRKSVVYSGESCTAFFTVLMYEDMSNPFFSIIIRDVHGLNIFYTNTNMLNIRLGSIKKYKLINVVTEIDMHLAPRDYFMSFVVSDNNVNEYCDRRVDALHFTVISGIKNCGGFVNLNPRMTCSELWTYSKT